MKKFLFLVLFIISCEEKNNVSKNLVKTYKNNNCEKKIINGVYHNSKFLVSSLNCIYFYDESLKLLKTYNLEKIFSFSKSNDSIFLISNNKIYVYYNDSIFEFKEIENLKGYENGIFILKDKVIIYNDTFLIPEIECYKIYKNKLFLGTNGYGLYIIENKRIKHYTIGKLPSNFIKALSLKYDSLIIGFSEPFSKSKVGFFKDEIIKVYEFSDDYITDIFSDNYELFIGTSNGLFRYKDKEFHKVLDGYISKILKFDKNKIFLILNGELKVLDLNKIKD